MTRLQYRGISYDNSRHQQPPATPVEHIYRGHHYNSSLRHEAAPVDPALELHYRGHVYHHQAAPQQR
jgi:hypothetical protein